MECRRRRRGVSSTASIRLGELDLWLGLGIGLGKRGMHEGRGRGAVESVQKLPDEFDVVGGGVPEHACHDVALELGELATWEEYAPSSKMPVTPCAAKNLMLAARTR